MSSLPSYLNRKENESFLDWKIRVVCAKIDREIDLDWQELVDILGLDCHYDTLRKSAYGIYEVVNHYKNNLKETVKDEDILNELELKKIELLEERKKLQTINAKYNKIVRENARFDLMLEAMKESIEKLPVPKFEPMYYKNNNNKKIGILTFGDIHFGKKFVSLYNEYSEEIAKERMENLIPETVDIVSKYGFEHIHIINGADSVEGISLRISMLRSLQSGLVDQVIKFSKFMAAWLNEMSKYVRVTYHHVPSSNHSQIRPFSSGRHDFPSEDMEKIIVHYIHDVLEDNDRVEVPIYKNDLIKFKIFDYNIGALHGHQLKNNKSAIKDLSLLHKTFFDYLFVSHFHHGNALTVGEGETNNIEIIQVPSVMGSDEFSDGLMIGAKASATFHVFEENKGRVAQYNILLN